MIQYLKVHIRYQKVNMNLLLDGKIGVNKL